VPDLTLRALEEAIRTSWGLDTCDPTDAGEWSSKNPARGQCAVTSLVVHDLIGGTLLEAKVQLADGTPQGYHYWNRFAGVDVDLTKEQFAPEEVVGEPQLIDRLPEFPWLAHDQYVVFRRRVYAALGLDDAPDGALADETGVREASEA
jgi:hypothetical protein